MCRAFEDLGTGGGVSNGGSESVRVRGGIFGRRGKCACVHG